MEQETMQKLLSSPKQGEERAAYMGVCFGVLLILPLSLYSDPPVIDFTNESGKPDGKERAIHTDPQALYRTGTSTKAVP